MLYQLYAEDKELLKKTNKILFIPDYISYVLTGNQVTEVTNASTSQMLNLQSSLFDKELMKSVDLAPDLFAPLVDPGTLLGYVLKKWKDQYNFTNELGA